jgi:Beta-propeller repeat
LAENGWIFVYGLAAAANGNIYVTGATDSTMFPTAGTPYSSTYSGGSNCQGAMLPCFEAFLSELSADGTSLVASTYLGGSSDDFPGANALALDSSGNVYLAGTTDSPNFPATVHLGTNSPHPGQADIFVVKMNSALSQLLYATEIGGSADDLGIAMRLDSTNAVYVTGTTGSTDFPATTGAYQTSSGGPASPTCPNTINPDGIVEGEPMCGDAFLLKLNPAGSALTFATYLGGSAPDSAYNLALDSSRDSWVVGDSLSSNYPFTSDAYYTGLSSVFLSEISADGSSLLYSTALSEGGAQGGIGLGIQIDSSNNVYVAGASTGVLATPGAYSTPSSPGIFLMKFSPGTARPGVQLSATRLAFIPPNYLVPVNTTSAPQTVTLTNNGTAALNLQLTLVPGVGASTTPFLESDNCGSTLAASSNRTITVNYVPTSPTAQDSATIVLVNNAPGAPQSIALTGTSGIIESASFVPATLTFTGQAPSTSSPSQTSAFTGSATSAATIETRTMAAPAAEPTHRTSRSTLPSAWSVNPSAR